MEEVRIGLCRNRKGCSSPWMGHYIFRMSRKRMPTGNTKSKNFKDEVLNLIIRIFSYACSLALPSMQSGHYGPFFRLVLPRSLQVAEFGPRIDEYQPQVFPEQPVRGQTVYIECFAYGK